MENIRATNQKAEIAYVLGALYGDGCFSNTKRGIRISFSSCDREFIDTVAKSITKLFGIRINIRRRRLSEKNPNWRDSFEFSSRRLFRFISEYVAKDKTHIPSFILESSKKIKSAFLRGFFDAEGSVDIHKVKSRGTIERHIICHSSNRGLLEEIKRILNELGIKSRIFRGNRAHKLTIWGYKSLINFKNNIGFVINRKKRLLEKAINSYKQIQIRWDIKTYDSVMKIRNDYGFGSKRIKELLNKEGISIGQPTIESWIYGRCKPIGGE